MATPTLVKTWSFDVSNIETCSGSEECGQETLFALKSALVSAGWAVAASSNQSSFSNVGVDHWATSADLIRTASGAHSWIVLYNSTMDVSFIIDYLSSADYQTDFYVVDGAVNADGTTSAKPTYAGNAKFYSNSYCAPGYSSCTQIVWSAMWSTDYKAFRFFVRSDAASSGNLAFFIQEPSNTPDLWTDPLIWAMTSSNTTDVAWSASNFFASRTTLLTRVNGAMTFGMYITGEGFASADVPAPTYTQASPCDLSSDAGYLICPMGLMGYDVGVRGSNGRIDDMWWAPVAMSKGDSVIVSGSRDFISMVDFLLPWNDTVPVIG